jgi:transcriptional regulator of acetoin/glycerol metabolism
MERALLLAGDGEVRPDHVVLDAPAAEDRPPPPGDDERARILAALESCAGNQTRAARLLGMSRTKFVQRLRHHAIRRPRTPR